MRKDANRRRCVYLTGLTELSTELSAKRLEILKDAVPNLRRVAMLWNAVDLGMTLRYKAAETAAQVLNVSVQPLGVREPNDFDHAFVEMIKSPPDAILMVSDALTTLNRKRVIEFASANRLPAIYEFRTLVRDGGLMSHTDRIKARWEPAPQISWLESCAEHGPRTCPSNSLQRSRWSSICKRPRHSVSLCRLHSSPAPTR